MKGRICYERKFKLEAWVRKGKDVVSNDVL